MATNGNDTIIFSGNLQQFTATLTNAYSGYTISIDEEKNVNDSTYDGMGGFDIMIMSNTGDVIFIDDGFGNQQFNNIELIIAGDGGDVVDLSSTTLIVNNGVTIAGGLGDDILWGNVGADVISGSDGNDILDGGPGNDTLQGENDFDIVFGGDGDDSLDGGNGDDFLSGDAGSDTYVFFGTNFGNDTIVEAATAELNTIKFQNSLTQGDLNFSFSGNDLIITAGTFGEITIEDQYAGGGAGIDTIVFSDNSTFDLRSVAQPNVDPVAQDDAFTGDEDADITGNVLTNDSDQNNGDMLTAVAGTYTTAQGGSVVLTANGDFIYTPTANFNGADSFSYTVEDGNGGSDTATVDLSVNSINDDPVAQDDSFSGNEDTDITGNVLGNDSDVDGDTLTAVAGTYTTAQGGTVVLEANGDFTYTPVADFFGTDTFDYSVIDGQGGSDVGTVTLDVADVAENLDANLDIRVSNGNTGQEFINSTDGYDLAAGAAGEVISVNGTEMDIAGVSANAQVTYSFADADSASVALDSAWNSVKNVEVSSDGAGNITLDNFVHTDVIFGGDGNSSSNITITDAKRGFITTGLGDDNVTIDALTNNAHWSNVFDIRTSNGADTIDFTGDKGISEVKIDAGQGDDNVVLKGDYKTSTVRLGGGDDEIQGGDGVDSIYGDRDNDTISGGGGDDGLYGGRGDDILNGDDGDDIIYGGDDNDIINGGAGNDIIYGGNNDMVLKDKDFDDDILFPELKERVSIKDIQGGEDALGVKDPNLNVDFEASATLTFRKGFAGYNNSLGIYKIAEDGTIEMGNLLWENVKDAGLNTAHTIDIPVGADGGDFGFFIIANGDRTNNGYNGLDTGAEGNIQFIYNYGEADERPATIYDNGGDVSVVYNDGATETVLKGHTYHTTDRGGSADINADGKTHSVSGLINEGDNEVLKIGFEDLKNLGDADFEDVLFEIDVQERLVEDNSERGRDTINGGAGNDTIYGEGGDDIINGGIGADTLNGGSGADEFVFDTIEDLAFDTIEDFTVGEDSINVQALLGNYSNGDDLSDFVMFYVENGNTFVKINADGGGFKKIALLEDVEITDSVDDLVNDGTLIIEEQIPDVDAPPVDPDEGDTFVGTDGNDIIEGGGKNDTLSGGDGDDQLYGYDGNDILSGDGGDDVIKAGNGDDILYGGAGNDSLRGGLGNDIFYGGDGNDRQYGDDDNDTFYSSLGHDDYYGGADADTVIFQKDTSFDIWDEIHGFNAAEGDVIDISDLIGDVFDPLQHAIDDFVKLANGSRDSYLRVDIDGGGDNFVQVAKLTGTTGLDLDTLIQNGNLIVDI